MERRVVLHEHLVTAPHYQKLAAEVERYERLAALERARTLPDLTVSVGTTRDRESGESTWVAGISVPVPVLDRNRGARRAAELELEQARRSVEAERVDLEVELAITAERLVTAARTAREIRDAIVPAAREAFDATRIGYREGKLGVLDVLDAEREVFDARMAWLDALEAAIAARLELELLIGRSLRAPATAPDLEADERAKVSANGETS
jgi:cobalt-zinc-cadmium efflux system outer membrane protein